MLTNITIGLVLSLAAALMVWRMRPPQGDLEPLSHDALKDIIRREGHKGDIGER